MRATLLLLTAAGCQQVFGLEAPEQRVVDDARADTDELVDGPADVVIPLGTCVQKWMQGPVFGTLAEVTEVKTAGAESDPFVTSDGLAMFFQRSNDVYLVQRLTISGTFGPTQLVADLSSAGVETKVFISPANDRAFFASGQAGGEGGIDLWRGAAAGGGGLLNWSVNQTYLDVVNDTSDQLDPHMNPALTRLYYSPIAGGAQTILLATRGDIAQSFGIPVPISELDGTGAEADPTLTDDELVIVFTSTKSGKRRLNYATRTNTNDAFGQVKELTQLNADLGQGDGDAHVSGDGCTLYWSSERNGNGDIFVATQL